MPLRVRLPPLIVFFLSACIRVIRGFIVFGYDRSRDPFC
jgi:hypothetical protein